MTEEKKESNLVMPQGEPEAPGPEEAGGTAAEHKTHHKKSVPELKAELMAAQEHIQRLREENQQKDQELVRQKDLYLRASAEMENLRKRTAKEKEEFAKYAQESLMLNLLPVVDNLERALEAAKNHQGNADPSTWQEGVNLVLKQFLDTLDKMGVKPIAAEGAPFDPHFHHAVMQVETGEAAEGTVVEVLQKGYLLKDRLLRPAMVKVATTPSEK